MEEADALADRAGIMARRMLALGTADQLRKKHGDAYHVHLVHKDAPHTSDADMEAIKSFIRKTFQGATTEDRVFHGQLRFSVPNDRTAIRSASKTSEKDTKDTTITSTSPLNKEGISALFTQLEANKEKLGFEYYSVSQATLDQVFLTIVGKHNVIEENYAREHQQKEGFGKKIKVAFGKDTWAAVLCGF
jgi:ATP-binding cassette, subfamily A (ABC1), member 3